MCVYSPGIDDEGEKNGSHSTTKRLRNRHSSLITTGLRLARLPLAPTHVDARTQHPVRLLSRLAVPVSVLTVRVDTEAHLHAPRAASERVGGGAAEGAEPLGVGVNLLGELEVFVGDAGRQHEEHPDPVARRLMRDAGVGLA